jgi:hypothetical protein
MALVVAPSLALADGGGGGGGAGDGSPLSAMDEIQRRAEERDRNLRTLQQGGRRPASQPRTSGQQPAPAAQPRPAPAVQTTAGMTQAAPNVGQVFTPGGTRWIPDFPGGPTGWFRRLTLTNGWRIYHYRDGSSVAVSPGGVIYR